MLLIRWPRFFSERFSYDFCLGFSMSTTECLLVASSQPVASIRFGFEIDFRLNLFASNLFVPSLFERRILNQDFDWPVDWPVGVFDQCMNLNYHHNEACSQVLIIDIPVAFNQNSNCLRVSSFQSNNRKVFGNSLLCQGFLLIYQIQRRSTKIGESKPLNQSLSRKTNRCRRWGRIVRNWIKMWTWRI